MSEGLENSEPQHNYAYQRFQRTTSYDPNMCTTAALFSPYYKNNAPKTTHQHPTTTINNFARAQRHSLNHIKNSPRAIVDTLYLPYQNKITSVDQSNHDPKMEFMGFNEQSSSHAGSCDVQYIKETVDDIETDVHRSTNSNLYQNFFVTNEDGNPEEIVELIPIDPSDVTHLVNAEGDSYTLQLHSYEFPNEHQMNPMIKSDSHQNEATNAEECRESQEQIMTTGMLTREQQRILLESTMSPLLAAVNDITQREGHFLSCLNEEERHSPEGVNLHRTDSTQDDDDDDDYILVSDRNVESRARASLPTNYLYLGPINTDTNEPSVFAAKKILRRTKFGPFEGEVRYTNDIFVNILRSQQPRHYPLLFVGKSRILIVTNENTSNWMRFVRLAQTFAEQNLQLIEDNDRIFFKCSRDIDPKEELRVGYHSSYAQKNDLPILVPSLEDTQSKYECDNPWMCFECDQRFPIFQDMQTHLKVHDLEDASCVISKRKFKRKRIKLRKVSELPKSSSRCLICFKVFMTSASLKKHFAQHLTAKQQTQTAKAPVTNRLFQKCSLCSKRLSSAEKLKLHQLTHTNKTDKPHKCTHCDQQCATPTALAAHIRSHTNRLYSCVFCQETFKYVLEFKKHVLKHKIDGVFSCFHCKKNYKEYHIVRRHIRTFHPAVKYPCNECDRLFLHMSFLRRHKATHAKKRTIQCSKCEACFPKNSELRKHIKTSHKSKPPKSNTKTKEPVKKSKVDVTIKDELIPKDKDKPSNRQPTADSGNYLQSQFKCEMCRIGFKRRGMLVNHLAKRHPEQNINAIEELNQPIVKLQTMFKCPHCPKLYKNNAKRKGHIIKNHPGLEVPASLRKVPTHTDPNIQTVGCIKADVYKCHLCYKQYVSRMRFVMHYRKSHPNQRIPQMVQHEYFSTNTLQNVLIDERCIEPAAGIMSFYRPEAPPVSPENKLLKLSSAALELSSIEDRKYFDFLNERSDTTEKNEFVESSPNVDVELNRLPELFEESIACI